MTPDCLRLDDYLDGRLSEPDAEAFETHTITCAACDAALDADAGLPDLATLRAVSCPPEVLDAALRTARRAPDRPAAARRARSRFSLPMVALALAALVALVIGLTRWTEAPPTPEPVIAQADPVPTEPTVPAPSDSDPEAADTTPETSDTAPEAGGVAASAPAPPRQAPPPRRRSTPPPQPEAPPVPVPSPDAAPDALPDEGIAQAAPEAEPSPEEIEAAQRDIALAFALVADARTRAGDALRTRAGTVSATLDQSLPF